MPKAKFYFRQSRQSSHSIVDCETCAVFLEFAESLIKFSGESSKNPSERWLRNLYRFLEFAESLTKLSGESSKSVKYVK